MIYVTGDLHGNPIERFSYKAHPELRELTSDDYMFVLGDCGVPWYNPDMKFYDIWTQPGAEKAEHYILNWLNQKPWKTFFIRGNHDNIDLIEQMPQVSMFSGNMRQMKYQDTTYENLFYIDTPQLFNVGDKTILVIPGAESHDADYIFEYDDPEIKTYIKTINKKNNDGEDIWYRINHVSYWEKEGVDLAKVKELMTAAPEKVDYIFTHAPNGKVHSMWKFPDAPGRLNPDPSEQILMDEVYGKINFKLWVHGHLHHHIELAPIYSLGIYHEILSADDLIQISGSMKIDNMYYESLKEANEWRRLHSSF